MQRCANVCKRGVQMTYTINEVIDIIGISRRTLYNNKDIMNDNECVTRIGSKNVFTDKAIKLLKQRYKKENLSSDEAETEAKIFENTEKQNLEMIKAEHEKEMQQMAMVFSGTIQAKDEVIKTLKDEHQKQIDILSEQVADLKEQIQTQNELLKKLTEKKSFFQRLFRM